MGLHQWLRVRALYATYFTRFTRKKIRTAFATIDRIECEEKVDFRLDICFFSKGSHVEHLWNKICVYFSVKSVLMLYWQYIFLRLPSMGGNNDTSCISGIYYFSTQQPCLSKFSVICASDWNGYLLFLMHYYIFPL